MLRARRSALRISGRLSCRSRVISPDAQQAKDALDRGALLARITVFRGKLLQEIHSLNAGEVLYVVATPSVNEGEPVGSVAERVAGPEWRAKR